MPNGNDPHNNPNKWPWSITDREFGALEQELKELRHDFRNLKQIINLSGASNLSKDEVAEIRASLSKNIHYSKDHGDSIQMMEDKVRHFNDELVKLKIKIYTAFSVLGVLFTVVVWLVDLAFNAMDKMN